MRKGVKHNLMKNLTNEKICVDDIQLTYNKFSKYSEFLSRHQRTALMIASTFGMALPAVLPVVYIDFILTTLLFRDCNYISYEIKTRETGVAVM